ncbi:23S rRNA pseudouridine2605 synthase [Chitinophaga jiangningensis]|uniref:Pseudouridine synthase n=1 Tax=Chitinophaga jiangningensis TaxID=1419482 RepID=A0A1M7H900_9BACT|nr:pseudouridine synthase [Chitinophaga jiangningensis]SHM25071.1 23S rRNA pseudouridine2605 synthase [Chitinophaga jiangningensis]
MKKKLPASKGFSPFKENKSGKSEKPAAGNRNRPSFDGERPGRASANDDTRKRSFGKPEDGDAPFRKRAAGKDAQDDKPAFRKRTFTKDGQDEKPAFRKRTFTKDGQDEKPAFRGKRPFNKDDQDEKPAFRGKRPFNKDDQEEKPAFRGKRPFNKDGQDEKPAFRGKRTFESDKPGRKKPDNYKSSSESSFHGDFENDKSARETPSGFNRKKFFDRTNDRFTDKHERRRKPVKRGESAAAPVFKKEAKEKKESIFGPGEMPLNKFIAHSGLCSRRKAVDYIREGKVTVNGEVVKEPATKVTAKDNVALLDKKLTIQKNLVYILLNKPKGYITTTDDPEGRRTVMDLIEDAVEEERVYPVGRLDRNTSGLLLLTNDGELAQKLAHPKHNIKKIYQVELDKPLTKADSEKIVAGLTLEDGVAFVDALGYIDPKDKKQVGIEIHSGKNRIVRRIFEHLEYNVEKLDRVMYAGLTKKNLNRGQWRFLTEKEVILLKHFK